MEDVNIIGELVKIVLGYGVLGAAAVGGVLWGIRKDAETTRRVEEANEQATRRVEEANERLITIALDAGRSIQESTKMVKRRTE